MKHKAKSYVHGVMDIININGVPGNIGIPIKYILDEVKANAEEIYG